jgi:nicotinate-nucleotide pyrophosphorylase (carboxylating)
VVSAEEVAEDAQRIAALALAEDGARDITSLVTIVPGQQGRARIEARAPLVLAGAAYADALITTADLVPAEWQAPEGAAVDAGAVICELHGSLGELLRVERPLLNVLQRACGIATLTARFVEVVSPTRCQVLHTRKTTPGLRVMEIAAVLAGGGKMHRRDLAHAVLVKDNHWAAMARSGRSLADALRAGTAAGARELGVEVETPDQVTEACLAGATRLLIDNQTPTVVREWVARARQLAPVTVIEASGGITLDNALDYALAGVDCISVGALTQTPAKVDLSLEME